MKQLLHWTLAACSLTAIILVSMGSDCPPPPPSTVTPPPATKTGSHQTLSFSAARTAVTFTPPPGSPYPASVSLNILVQIYDDYSDKTTKLSGPAKNVEVTLATTDPTNKCVKLSTTSLTTDNAGKAMATASAAVAVLTPCTVTFTATAATATNSPLEANVRNVPN